VELFFYNSSSAVAVLMCQCYSHNACYFTRVLTLVPMHGSYVGALGERIFRSCLNNIAGLEMQHYLQTDA